VSLTAKDVAQITRLLEESNFDELYLELDGLKLSLRRGSAANVQSVVGAAMAPAPTPVRPATPASTRTMPGSPAVAPASLTAAPASLAAAPVSLAATSASSLAPSASCAASPDASPASPAAQTAWAEATDPNTLADPNTVTVSAPLLGTFYRAPKPGAPPFVEIGSQVEEDTIVGIIEVMKLMNTVRAGVRGKVIQILGRDGALVEYGETLMHVSKTS
jgi:acetyl-CoA carboxylase biotin carboxyl carrier protein